MALIKTVFQNCYLLKMRIQAAFCKKYIRDSRICDTVSSLILDVNIMYSAKQPLQAVDKHNILSYGRVQKYQPWVI